ncbi:MAG: transposase, partial [Eubacterium sp.]|nr:transposase [Eubacterium sp.]
MNRKSDIIFYDVTNFYYETEDPDEDIVDEEGNIIEKGIRKMGVSKENRKQPIVQMGLFMDNSGIPIAIESFPGNTLDHLTVKPAMNKHISNLDLSRFIMIADRGICNYKTVAELLSSDNGYIMSKSLLKSKKQDRQWAYNDTNY